MRCLIILFVICWFSPLAQDSQSGWTLLEEYEVGNDGLWSADILQNVYVVHNRLITKYDSAGVKKFSQSIKSLGQVKEIMPINTMKLVLFSEDQQVLCMLDNTLTISEDLVDLSDYGIVNASLVTTSSQSEKIWVLDQLNSRLLLIDLSGKMQFQEVRNLKGALNLSVITSMFESNGHLFLIGSGKYYQFDIYGTLLKESTFTDAYDTVLSCFPSGERFYWIIGDELVVQNLDGGDKLRMKLPLKQISEFKKAGDIYYFRTGDKIFKYAFKNIR